MNVQRDTPAVALKSRVLQAVACRLNVGPVFALLTSYKFFNDWKKLVEKNEVQITVATAYP